MEKHNKRRALDDIIRFTTTIAEDTRFTGSFDGGHDYVVRGSVTGDSVVSGAVVITQGGHWTGNLTADIIVVGGQVEGDLVAREKLEILNTARVTGNLQSPVLAIAKGAVHEGQLRMREQTQVTEFEERRTEPSTGPK